MFNKLSQTLKKIEQVEANPNDKISDLKAKVAEAARRHFDLKKYYWSFKGK